MASKMLLTLLILPLLSLVSARAVPQRYVAPTSLRVLPLGASITFGTQSTDGNGYRKDLRDKLVAEKYSVNMVGSRTAGTMCDNDVEGWPGFVITQVQDKASLSVGTKPNVILVNAGTNDCVQNIDTDNADARLGTLIDYLLTQVPGTTVIASTLLVNGNNNTETCVQKVNAKYKTMVAARAAAGKKVLIVDMHAADGPQASELVDGTHPNDAGYAKMAAIWDRGIAQAVTNKWLTAAATSTLPNDGCAKK